MPAQPEPSPPSPSQTGKGRATPKRRDAEKRRAPLAAPQTRKEAAARQRELVRSQRAKQRAALRSGAGPDLPPRDRGPEKALARDLVDSRRGVGILLLPSAVLILLAQAASKNAQAIAFLLWLAILLGMIIDSVLLGRRILRETRTRFPQSTVRGRTLVAYSIQRSTVFRRLRLPKPRVRPGDTV